MENGMTNDEFEASYKFVKELEKLNNYCTCDRGDGLEFHINLDLLICLNCNKKILI